MHKPTFIHNFVTPFCKCQKQTSMNIRISAIIASLCCTMFMAAAEISNLPKKLINGKEFYVYKVARAEGLYAISNKFEISQEEIIKYNPSAKNGLKLDQILLIPTSRSGNESVADENNTDAEEVSTFRHTIKRGESLYSISKMYGVTIKAILEANPGTTQNIKAGAILNIPQKIQKKSSSASTSPTVRRNEPTAASASAESADANDYTFHTIVRGETLFHIAQQYNCGIEDILRANPGIKPNRLYDGSVIRIPQTAAYKDEPTLEQVSDTTSVTQYVTYTVKRKETLYSIAKKFDITVDALKEANPGVRTVKKGNKINIPEQKVEITSHSVPTVTDEQINDLYSRIYERKNAKHINVAVILPFMLQHKPDIKAALYTEYYQGFLLAVDSLKRQGFSVNVYAYDTEGSLNKVRNILNNGVISSMDLIIAPDNDEMIDLIADYSAQYDINVVNTFSIKNEKANTNARVFQTNIPHSYLYAETAERFIRLFYNREVIFLSNAADSAEMYDFVPLLQTELTNNGIAYRTCTYQNTLSQEELAKAVNNSASVIFVPTSNKQQVPDAILSSLTTFVDNNPQCKVSLFGFPGWLVQANSHLNEFYKLDTYIFSRFYTDPGDAQKLNFDLKFNYWYNDEMIKASPQYGLLGFDTGLYFLQAVAKNGKNFSNYDLTPSGNALQTDFRFERINNWSGFINKSFYFIHFTPYMTTEKIKE